MIHTAFRRLSWLAAAGGVAMVASRCHRTRAPDVSPTGVLGVPSTDAPPSARGPFAVVFASPEGESADASEVTVMWNRPMRALDLAGAEAPPPVRLTPPIPGDWHWVGTSAVTFRPKPRLAYATDYEVVVDKGTRSLAGDLLGEAFVLRFSTPAPAIVRSQPSEGDAHVAPNDRFVLRWNQPVADAEVVRSVRIVAGAVPLAFDARHPDPKNAMLVELTPKSPLPTGRKLELVVGAAMRGVEGARTSGVEQRLAFRTYGPLTIETVDCDRDTPHGRCAATGSVSLTLSNEARVGDLKRALVLDPPLPIEWNGRPDDETTRYVSVDARFLPASAVTLTLRASSANGSGKAAPLRDVYGQALARDWSTQLAFDDLWPSAQIGVRGVYLEGSARDLPIASVNLSSMRMATLALTPETALRLSELERGGTAGIEQLIDLGAVASAARPTGGRNALSSLWIKGQEVLAGASKGPLAVALSYLERPAAADKRNITRSRVVQFTDLGISAKLAPEGAVIWVTRLSTGLPVAGASVEMRRSARAGGEGSGSFTTDADGFAVIPKERFAPVSRESDPAIIFVRSEDDWCYRRANDVLRGWRFGVTDEARSEPRSLGILFSERGIYRPGDVAKIKGVARSPAPRGLTTRPGVPVAVQVSGPDGEVVSTQSQVVSEFGTFAIDARVPPSGKLGTYGVAALIDGAPESEAIRASFEVAEYRPAEFKVAATPDLPVSSPGVLPAFTRGDAARWTLNAEYLFGAPMSNAEVRYTVSRAPDGFSPKVPDGFTTSDSAFRSDLSEEASPRVSQLLQGTGRLDASGKLSIAVPLAMAGQIGAEHVTCEAEVSDVSRQTISGSVSTVVHPADVYVGVRAGVDFFARPGVVAHPEVVVVDPASAPRAGVRVHLDLVRRTFGLVRQVGSAGSMHNVVSTVDDVVGSCDVESGSAPVSCALLPKTGGYHVVHATARDSRGNPVSSSQGFYVIGAGEIGWGDNDEHRVELVPDKASYQPGDTAHVLVKSPFKSAEAWITVERAGVYTRSRTRLEGAMPTIDVPITEDLRPNAFVSVLMIKGRSRAAPTDPGAADVGAPTYRAGYASLLVDPASRKLTVALRTSKPAYAPGEQVVVDVDVRDRAQHGARSEVTLYAVDEGVLSLIGYQTPDPLAVFAAPRPLLVSTLESRDALGAIRVASGHGAFPLLDKGLEGGGGDNGGRSVRRDFRQSAYFNPSLVSDEQGHARASFQLPDSLTSYRIMAVAVAADDRFGSAETTVVASRPLMARPAFPRVLRAGDVIDAGVVLTSKGLGSTQVQVQAKPVGLELLSADKQVVSLQAGASVEARFRFRASTAGPIKVTFSARADDGAVKASDVVEVGRTVLSPSALEAVALYGETSTASAEKLGDLSSIRSDVGQLELSVSSTALTGLGGGIGQLVEYPYGCTEQLTSRLVPLLPLSDLARDFHLELPKDVPEVVARTVSAILKNQRDDGGFGLFAQSDRSWPWASIYALWGLGEAQRRNVDVPASAVAAATAYVRGQLESWDASRESAAVAAFAVSVLAENGGREPAWLERLFQGRAKLPLFARAMLLRAMVQSEADKSAITELAGEIEREIRLDGKVARAVVNEADAYAALLDSETRTTALVLRALLAANPAHPLGSRLAMGLLADRQGGAWRSTQETAWALLAIDAYRRAQERVVPAFDARAFLGNTEVLAAAFQGRSAVSASAVVPAARALQSRGSNLAFAVRGQGTLFYEARLRYAKRELPTSALDRGFFVEKRLTRVRPEELASKLREPLAATTTAELAGADLVLADVVVVTPTPRNFVVVEDPLAAGLEAIDSRLATSAASLDVESLSEGAEAEASRGGDEDAESDRRASSTEVLSTRAVREVRDDRVLFFVEHMRAGVHRFRYLARATTLGTFVQPPTSAAEMYAPEVFGRTGASTLVVRGSTP